ncbi:MAG: V-type ATPase subunit subunit G family protein [Eubacteriales bacterium]|nr:V-type ATPase subunit subunit G family protein [Eubacteriales bacterium]
MVSKTIDLILSSEKDAAEKLEVAHKNAEQLIKDADEKAKEIFNNSNVTAKSETEKITKKVKNQTDDIFEDFAKKTGLEIAGLKKQAENNKERAINLVINKIISGQ